jgi:DNA-binding transcriptional LysR family regulator
LRAPGTSGRRRSACTWPSRHCRRQIRQLEAQVGATLFDRTTRRVDLTPAGEAFLRDAERILAAIEDAEARVRYMGEGSTGLLRIGSTGLTA